MNIEINSQDQGEKQQAGEVDIAEAIKNQQQQD